MLAERPHSAADRQQYTYYPHVADVPESAGAAINGRSYTIAAGVDIESVDAHGVLYAHGGVAGGHSLYIKDKKLRYSFNWLGTKLYEIVVDAQISPGRHVLTADFASSGRSTDPEMPGFQGTLTLYADKEKVGEGEIITQPGDFCLVGDGICVGRDSASPVTPEYSAPFAFTGGTIDKVVVDVSGEKFVDHENKVMSWFAID